MAPILSGNPLTIAAADVTPAALGTAAFLQVWTGNVHILNIEFEGYVAAGDVCTIWDNASRVMWQGHGSADLTTQRSGNMGWSGGGIGGIRIPVNGITNGFVRIYIK